MNYQLYTLLNCEKCKEIKEILEQTGIVYEEINLGARQGVEKFKEIYRNMHDSFMRDENNMMILPILVKKNESKIETILQGVENIKNLFLS